MFPLWDVKDLGVLLRQEAQRFQDPESPGDGCRQEGPGGGVGRGAALGASPPLVGSSSAS